MNYFLGLIICAVVFYLLGWITTARYFTGKWFVFSKQ